MIKKLFNQKKKTASKQGSMLTLVMVILAMALILITSAIQITNATRARYIDRTLSSQARTTATSVAEFLVKAIQSQEITDKDLEDWSSGEGTSATVNAPIPGTNGAADTKTTVKFSQGSGYVYIDVSCTIGKLSDGHDATENVRVYLKKQPKDPKVSLFDHMMEVGKTLNFGGFNVGKGAPEGAKNTVFSHGDIALSSQAGNTLESDLIVTGRLTPGNGGSYKNVVLAGPDAGFSSSFSGNLNIKNIFFMSPKSYTKGTVVPVGGGTENGNIDLSPETATYYNVSINTNLRTPGASYNYGLATNDLYVGGDINQTNIDNLNKALAATPTDDMKANAEKMLNLAFSSLKEENQFPTLDKAQSMFYAGVDPAVLSAPPMYYNLAAGTTIQKITKPGVYYLPSKVNCKIEADLTKGPIIFIVQEDTVIDYKAGIMFTNGDPDPDKTGTWGRIIINEGCTLDIGGSTSANASDFSGIVSTNRTSGNTGSAPAGSKPTCFIYGYKGSKVTIDGSNKYLEAYIGLYGDDSTIKMSGKNFLAGRHSSTLYDSPNCNGTELPYCPGPNEKPTDGSKIVKKTQYEVIRFRYYYGDVPTT